MTTEPKQLTTFGTVRGRGTASNPVNRFELVEIELDGDWVDDEVRDARGGGGVVESGRSHALLPGSHARDHREQQSPDVGFDASINPYRGCEHGCVYCYARPTHEYLGFSAGLDFETKIFVKEDAPELLRRELSQPKWKPQVHRRSAA